MDKIQITIQDASHYFKGLLLLVRKDGKISEPEAGIVMEIGKKLGFEREFCQNALRDILANKHISEDAPRFSSLEAAKSFIRDGVRLAFADRDVHPFEQQWLEKIAGINNIDPDWMSEELKRLTSLTDPSELDVHSLVVVYS